MQVELSKINHPKDGYTIDFNCLLDLTKIFVKRDTEIRDRDYCVYVFKDSFGVIQYYGMGRYWNINKYSKKEWLKSRPFTHRNDLLCNCIKCDWTCCILGMGLSSTEAHVLEAYLLQKDNRRLTPIKSTIWNNEFLINKKYEKKWENLIPKYINNGNYTWIINAR